MLSFVFFTFQAATRERWESGTGKATARYVKRRTSPYMELNEALFKWFCDARSRNLPVTGSLLQEKALLISSEMGHDNFSASNGWLESWRNRYNVSWSSLCGESASVDQETLADWKLRLPDITRGYGPEDIFNADETGLFYRALPNKSMTHTSDSNSGIKIQKDRITVLIACSATGEKLPLLVIGKAAKPRCFKGLQTASLGVRWEHNKKAWMTTVLFTQWLERLNNQMRLQNRSILLLVDNCTAHPEVNLSNVKIVFLPKNTTSHLQPCDAGIIQAMKLHYRKRMLRNLILQMTTVDSASDLAKKITVLDAVYWVKQAWDQVEKSTIVACFSKCGISATQLTPAEELPDCDVTETEDFSDALGTMSIEDYACLDEDLEIAADVTAVTTVDSTCDEEEDSLSLFLSDDEESEAELPPVPTIAEMMRQLRAMKTHGLKNADKDFLNAVNATEDALMKQATRASHMVQANLFNFLEKR